ncbi:mitochondrial protein from FMP27-domain-containing protein [Microdochium bolleyi]|uniref:Mitochondrial protein from FMP27-domain-containing protein n=1 Tax=Microdochium bolleyi TaxID=196109 RepID=A0A136JB88_9PEZI|nr:mitochondrial protein from FMP27-domain-containing protein [Microdochium bolleyi]
MALLNPTFILGIVLLLYLSSFVLFAILRILTGISIQRIGYFSLRRLAYIPRDGTKVDIRGLGLTLHRPTFSQPTWMSIVLNELTITIDPKELEASRTQAAAKQSDESTTASDDLKPRKLSVAGPPRSQIWKKLARLRDRVKRLHRNVRWLRLVDVVATDTTISVVGVGKIQVGNLTVALDTRHRMVDRARFFFQGAADKKRSKTSAEWIMTLRSVLFTASGGESVEVLDAATLNVHGFLYEQLDGLRDAAIALKLGRVHIPYDDVLSCASRYRRIKASVASSFTDAESIPVLKLGSDRLEPEDSDQDLLMAVSDSREFISSILRGIKEVQFAVSFASLGKKVDAVQTTGSPLLLNASMKEVGIDLHRLDPKSPAHRMYFSSKDIAHEAQAVALSISVGLDDGSGTPEKIVYIPMATTTLRTTLPSKTMELAQEGTVEQRNANILFANSVVTSPSVDLEPKHLPILLAILKPKPKKAKGQTHRRHALISRLLPKANIKFTMHEPVLRIALPPVTKTEDPDDYDLINSTISSISLDLESFHPAADDLHYSLVSSMRVQTHRLYYQTTQGDRYDLVETDSFDLKLQISANPNVHVVGSGHLQTFAIRMTRDEISEGIRQIIRQLRLNVQPDKRHSSMSQSPRNILRALPTWLLHFTLQIDDFSAEIAGVDEDFPNHTRGVSFQVDSWSAEYRAQRMDATKPRPSSRRRTASRVLLPDPELLAAVSVPPSPRKHQAQGDGRRVAIHIRGLEGFIIEAEDRFEQDPFIRLPRFEVALSTLSDAHSPILHVHSYLRTLHLRYSLFRHYSVGIAILVLRKAFMRSKWVRRPDVALAAGSTAADSHLTPPEVSTESPIAGEMRKPWNKDVKELVAVDFKAAMVQLKADMPSGPPLMLRFHDIEAGRHRWSPPFFYAKHVRLYADAPQMRGAWARVASIRTIRLDYRESRKKMNSGAVIEDKLVDIVTDAVRLSVPHGLVIYKISNGVVNVMKSVRQLQHRFKTGTNEYILSKGPEAAKTVPKISLRVRKLLFEIEDGAFEFKLGMIYRAGRIEQRQRLAREDAYRLKVKKIHEQELKNQSGRLRNRSALPRGRTTNANGSWHRSRSADDEPSAEDKARSRSVGHNTKAPRYDPDNLQAMSGSSRVSVQEARMQLHIRNGESWKHRIQSHYAMARTGMEEIRGLFLGSEPTPPDYEECENILEVPPRPALAGAIITDLHFMVDKPSFPSSKLADFLHDVGKGMPKDMKYSLLVPMHVNLTLSEARFSLRDYPLPLVHVPALKPGQSSKLPSMSLSADFVIAEEYRTDVAARSVKVQITPPSTDADGNEHKGFAIDVRRTIGPVKSFSDIQIDINTVNPTRFTWGPSYQPAIQDMMMAIESFTKPQFDPSERVGFWDKIRLNFHSRVRVAWKGRGDVHFALKGSRDPYFITGNGAGFLMCWRKDVRWRINTEDDPTQFMLVDGNEYVLAIPDYNQQVREAERRHDHNESLASDTHHRAGAAFKKVVMKLSGNVQWMAGLVFERALEPDAKGHKHRGATSFVFKPHYDVVLRSPQQVNAEQARLEDGKSLPYDAYRGFRSNHIHLSVAIKAPSDRDWTYSDAQPASKSYNSIHLTPRFFTHFFAWWSLFGGPMSLPIRQGSLWPDRDQKSKKFGRHLATIKYNILLAPLFLSHIYKHKDVEDYADSSISATGIKVRFDSFMLDIHQRREEFNAQDNGRKTKARTSGMKIHAASLDLTSTDIRAVSSALKATSGDAFKTGKTPSMSMQVSEPIADLSNFTIPDKDLSWIDMDDFVELDWILPTEVNPETKILPLAYAPRVTYFRQTDIGGIIDGDPERTSPFGDEPTHHCIMSQDDNPRRVQADLIQARLAEIERQMQDNIRQAGEAELRVIRDDGRDAGLKADYDSLNRFTHVLREKQAFMKRMLKQMENNETRPQTSLSASTASGSSHSKNSDTWIDTGDGPMPVPSGAEFASDFSNRFVVHNMQMKWNNLLRNIILRYSHQVSQRRGFVYYMSRPAVKFILDIVEDQVKAKQNAKTKTGTDASNTPSQQTDATNTDIESLMSQVLQDGRNFVDAGSGDSDKDDAGMTNLVGGLADGFAPQSSYHMRLIAPQIQLQSDKNKKHAVLITGKGMELKVVEVMEKARLSDTVSGLVQRRFLLSMDSAQFFVAHQKWFTDPMVVMYSANRYGAVAGASWPPWVPMEIMFDFNADPFGFKRVVQKTSALLRYDKYNNLRLKYNDEVNTETTGASAAASMESRTDNLSVVFPRIRALCNSSQYFALYVMVLDLLMYSEPLEKSRSERLEKIMLASDFSDMRGTPEMVVRLQERIRVLEEIKGRFQLHSHNIDKKVWEERMILERDLAACEDELFFMMKAITTSQRKYDAPDDGNTLLRWSLRAREIVWQLIRDSNQPLVEMQLRDTNYDRTDYADGSHKNFFQVGRVLGLNLLPNAIYPEMVAPFFENEAAVGNLQKRKMISVYWNMLESVAGIPVMERFDVDLFPMKIQLERDLGAKLFEYIFPGMEKDVPSANDTDGGQPWTGDESGGDGDAASFSGSTRLGTASSDKDSPFSTRAGSLELRLRPTLNSETPESTPSRPKGISLHTGDGHHFRLFGSKTASKKPSHESLRPPTAGRGVRRSATGSTMATINGDNKKSASRFVRMAKPETPVEEEGPTDDLSTMMKRANTYVVFASIRAASVVLCLSYKGKGERNIEDVHDLVFRLPMIEFHNKSWSTLELALAMKSHVVKALFSHTGAIIGNKFSKHRPNTAQQSKLRELATSSVLLSTPAMSNSVENSDDSSSLFGGSQIDYSRSPPRSITGSQSSIPVPQRSNSRSSSIASSRSRTHGKNGADQGGTIRAVAPAWLTMTPPTPQDRGPGSLPFAEELARRPQTSGGDLRVRPVTPGSRRVTHEVAFEDEAEKPRRKSAGGGYLKGKLNALTNRLRDRDGSTVSSHNGDDTRDSPRDTEDGEGDSEQQRFKTAAQRVKTG